MEMRKTDAFWLNSLALGQNTDLLFYLATQSESTADQGDSSGVNIYQLLKAIEISLHKYGIQKEGSPNTYRAVAEMVTTIFENEDDVINKYHLNNYPNKINIPIFAIGRMLAIINDHEQNNNALLAIREVIPELYSLIDYATEDQNRLIIDVKKVMEYISEETEICEAKALIEDARRQSLEHQIEELKASNKLSLKTSFIQDLVTSITNFEKESSDLISDKVRLSEEEIAEIILDTQ